MRVASLLNEAGRQGVEAAWEQTDEFHEKWKVKSREFLARTEWSKRKTIKRVSLRCYLLPLLLLPQASLPLCH